MLVLQVKGEDNKEFTLLVGDPKEKDYSLKPIELPGQTVLDHSFNTLDISEHSVSLQISNGDEYLLHGNIYISDSTGVRYSLALNGIVRSLDGWCDFEAVRDMEGIYLSNIYDIETLGGLKGSENDPTFEDYKMTRISFNKGSTWQLLTPPGRDIDGRRIVCHADEGCSLHLHGVSSDFTSVYSPDKTLGIIIGTGNVGSYLSNNPDEINTYLSRDAGLTWFEVLINIEIY